MVKISPISWREFVKIFEKEGWVFSRTKGDHVIYTKRCYARPVVISKDNVIEVFVIKNNLRTAMISRERYFVLLKDK